MATLDDALVARFPKLSAAALQEIIDSELADAELHNFLNMAFYISRPLVGKLGACGGVRAEEAIVKVLAAHFLTMYEQQASSVSTGEWSVRYRGNFAGEGLRASNYGQQALVMDCSGTLAQIGSGDKVARMEAITYNDLADDPDTPTTPVL